MAASRPVQTAGEETEIDTVSLFEACIEVLASIRTGNRKSAAAFVKVVRMAAASEPPVKPLPPFPSHETIETIMTEGSDQEFEALLASQQAFFERVMAEMTDGQLSSTIRRLSRGRQQRSA